MAPRRPRRKRIVRTPTPSESSESSEEQIPITTTAQQRRARAAESNQINAPPSHNKRPRIEDEHDHDNEFESLAQNKTSDTPSSATPTLTNYHELGLEWGLASAEQNLALLKLPKNNRLSTTGLYEAQALQAAYELDKTMLCIVLKVSRKVLDEAL